MSDWFRRKSAGDKLMTASAIGLLIGCGLCGAAGVAPDRMNPDLIYYVGLAVFWVSALGLVVTILWAALSGLMTKRDE